MLLLLPLALQALLTFLDEFVHHRRRGLGRWERWGHPLDTLSVLACWAYAARTEFSLARLPVFVGLCVFSCLFVTKDEFVHQRECAPGETWLHALLFILHPVSLGTAGLLWYLRDTPQVPWAVLLAPWDGSAWTVVLNAQCALLSTFFVYQFAFWSLPWRSRPR
ncbi:MAG: hypothetical protein EOO71_22100 [Myxococcaceae bacterium]|nr:MAG: hypothetical protein EOO71_22100 [Myxococcaceae bacterium]